MSKMNKVTSVLLAGTLTVSGFSGSLKVLANEQTTNEEEISSIQTEAQDLSGVSEEEMQDDFQNQKTTKTTIVDENQGISTNSLDEVDEDNYKYLSDLNYESSSKVGWGSIQKDKDVEGGIITLKVNGTKTTFKKGMGAHATSNLIYHISDLKNKGYTVLSTYAGVDYDKNGKSDGVSFHVWGSVDGKEWTELDKTETLKPADDAKYFNIDVKAYEYIKLEARSEGSNASDHSVYGDLRLLKTDYDVASENYQGIQTVAQYDAQISKNSVEENMKNHKDLILKRELVNRIGYQAIQNVYKEKPEQLQKTLDWLLNDTENLQLFIEAGGYFSGSGENALNALVNLYTAYSDDMGNKTYKKMLLATAVAYSKNIRTFLVNYGGVATASDPVVKYKYFKQLYDEGLFVRKSEFDNYTMEIMRTVMDARINDEEISWLRNYIEKKYPALTSLNVWQRYNGYGYAKYERPNWGRDDFYAEENKESWDQKYDFSKYGISYGEKNRYRLWMVMEQGAICWGLSGLGMVVNEVQGIPAIGTFQPGHEAYMLYKQNADGKGTWSISDNISGYKNSFTRWGNSTGIEHRLLLEWGQKEYNVLNSGNNTSYILLAQDALNDYDNYLNSMFYVLLSNSYAQGSAQHEEALKKALQSYNKNIDALYALYKSYKNDDNITDDEWVALAQHISTNLRYFPAPMVDLLNLIQKQVTDESKLFAISLMKTESLQLASKATSKESLQDGACREVANSLLGKESISLASFSFSGDKKNTIVLDESYAPYTVQVRVSLDGGNTWETFENNETFTTQHEIKLSDEQVSRITADKDILVGLMGTTANYTIDIKDGQKVGSGLYKNDDENVIVGNTDNLQYSVDNGVTWNDYVGGIQSDIRFDGHIVVKFRYKAHDNYVQGPVDQYTFNVDKNEATSQYLQLRHVSLYDYSSQQSDRSDHAAIGFIDGNVNTSWFTKFDTYDAKYYAVEFDQVRYITKVTYLPYIQNGRLKSGEIYTSMNGKDWTLVHEFSDLANNTDLKTIDLGKAVQAKYLKIVATENYGDNETNAKMYFSGKMLGFYEDTTKVYMEEPELSYSTTDLTNENVTATLKLPEGCESMNTTSYEFEKNGTFTFEYKDPNGVVKTVDANVTWIDKEAPTATVTYSTESPTNGEVVATLSDLSENVIGDTSYTFTENGTHDFIIRDAAGNTATIQAKVTWIDKEAPVLGVTFDKDSATNTNVVATLNGYDNTDTILDGSNGVYTFTENGTYTFKVQDAAGNVSELPVEVTWIDREKPVADIVYSIQDATTDNVIARLENISSDAKVVGESTYTFTENGSYEFKLVDEAGNENTITATVDWIDREAPNVSLVYSTEKLTNEDVTVSVQGMKDDEYVVDGDASYTFTENGTHTFIVRDKAGNTTVLNANVTWIDKIKASAKIVYSETEWTSDPVTVSLKDLSEEVEFIDGSNGTYKFSENGVYTFKLKDKAGNITEYTVKVANIDKEKPSVTVNKTSDKDGVYAQLNLGNSKVEVVLVNGDVADALYKMTADGTYVYRLRNASGDEFNYTVKLEGLKQEQNDANTVGGNTSSNNGNVSNGNDTTTEENGSTSDTNDKTETVEDSSDQTSNKEESKPVQKPSKPSFVQSVVSFFHKIFSSIKSVFKF